MATIAQVKNATIYTTHQDGEMKSARMETATRTLSMVKGAGATWSLFLEDKTRTTMHGLPVSLRTYAGKTWDEAIAYWDAKLKQASN